MKGVQINSKYSGEESLILNGKELPYTMLNYWQVNLSEILLNMTRGGFAEFIVQCAMHAGGFDAFKDINLKNGIEPYDLDGPDIPVLNRSSRIEVKSAAAVQLNTPDDVDLSDFPHSRLVFRIKKSIDYSKDEIPRHNSDLYVFAHYTATRKSDNMLDMKNWDFYVYPTFKIDENTDAKLSEQKTISLTRIEQIGIPKQSFETLYSEITKVIEEINDHEAAKA